MSSFLAWNILMLLGEYALLSLLVALLYRCELRAMGADDSSSLEKYFQGPPFRATYLSLSRGKWMFLLAVFRFVCLCYFAAVAFLWSLARTGGEDAVYFSLWHVFLVTVYFLLATIASLKGISAEGERSSSSSSSSSSSHAHTHAHEVYSNRANDSAQGLATAVQIFFEVAGGTSFFVTLAVFLAKDARMTFWNVTHHLAISLVFIVELALNRVPIRWEHILLNEAWLLVYLFVIWPLVYRSVWREYPYNFLDTGAQSSLVEYSIAAAISCAMYLAWFSLGLVRDGLWLAAKQERGEADFEGMESSAASARQSRSVANPASPITHF